MYFRFGLEAGVATASDGALCIVIDNNPSLGFFYHLPAGVTTPITSDATFQSLFSTYPYTYFPGTLDPGDGAALPSTPYRYGDPVQVVYGSPGLPLAGPFPLPATVAGGKCDDNAVLGFLVNSDSSCHRIIPNITTACTQGTPLDASWYVKTVVQQSVSTAPTTVVVQPVAALRAPAVFGGQCINMVIGVSMKAFKEVCNSASDLSFLQITYTITWSLVATTPSIQSVSAAVTYGNATIPATMQTWIAVGQKFSVRWQEVSETSSHTLCPTGTSSVLFDPDPISGFTMPAMMYDAAAGRMRCTGIGADRSARVVVGFGEDISGSRGLGELKLAGSEHVGYNAGYAAPGGMGKCARFESGSMLRRPCFPVSRVSLDGSRIPTEPTTDHLVRSHTIRTRVIPVSV
ncbi:hypothetical protein HDU93_005699 [Gonapodya sp. JEL0774]|nr:hypothetical protein HDU93_005699 [Gonapodya sp. JEL0774]